MISLETSTSDFPSKSGGIHVTNDKNNVLELYGNFCTGFNITPPIFVNKFTRLNLTIEAADDFNVQVCIPESVADFCTTKQCFTIDKPGKYPDIDLGHTVNGKRTNMSFLTVAQNMNRTDYNSPVTISGWTFSYGPNTDIVDEQNKCKDENALPEPIGVQKCLCKDGFVSSNGGKEQSITDECVTCLSSEYCSFEGGYCESKGDIVCGFGKEMCIDNIRI